MKAECEHGLDPRLPCGDCQKDYEADNAPSSCSSPSACSSSVTVRRLFDGWGVQFSVGVQHFDVGPQDYEMEREAEWMATMFRNALAKTNSVLDRSRLPNTEKGGKYGA